MIKLQTKRQKNLWLTHLWKISSLSIRHGWLPEEIFLKFRYRYFSKISGRIDIKNNFFTKTLETNNHKNLQAWFRNSADEHILIFTQHFDQPQFSIEI